MQGQAVEVAQDAMDKFSLEKDIAQYIKKEVRSARGIYLQTEHENIADLVKSSIPVLEQHGIASLAAILAASSRMVRKKA